MKPVDVRNEAFEQLKRRLDGDRRRVYEYLLAVGPRTTRALAEQMGMSILTVRPRVTELCEMGFVELFRKTLREGVYRALSVDAVELRHECQRMARAEQMMML